MGGLRSDMVVVVPPPANDGPGFGQGREPLLVQALATELAVEALDEAVLLGLPGSMWRQPTPVRLAHSSMALDVTSVRCRDDQRRLASPGDQRIQLARHAPAADRGVDHQRQRLGREVVHNAQDAKAPLGQGVGSATKSRLQRWFGLSGTTVGARIPVAHLRRVIDAPPDLLPDTAKTASSCSG